MDTTDTPAGTVLHRTCGDASALQADLGDGNSLVMIGNLRVIIRPESEKMWVAQGLEIDFTADGESLDDVQEAFAKGLFLTVKENLRVFGSLNPMLKTAPVEIWHDFLTGAAEHQFVHTQTSLHKVAGMALEFYVQRAA